MGFRKGGGHLKGCREQFSVAARQKPHYRQYSPPRSYDQSHDGDDGSNEGFSK